MNLRKTIVAMTLLLAFIFSCAAADEYVCGGENRAVATELQSGIMYEAQGIPDSALTRPAQRDEGWFVLDTRDYDTVLIHYPIVTNKRSRRFYIFDETGELMLETDYIYLNDEGTFEIKTLGNEKLYIQIQVNTDLFNGKPEDKISRFTICLDGSNNSTHQWQAVKKDIIVTEPTCSKPGTRATMQCALCETYGGFEEIPPAAHRPAEWIVESVPNCSSTGCQVQYCEQCGELLNRQELPAKGHSPGNWVEEWSASCTENGVRVQRCSVCYEILNSESIPALGHAEGEWYTAYDADCMQEGLREFYCLRCYTVLESESIPMLEHVFSEWITVSKPTFSNGGEMYRYCINCGAEEARSIPRKKFLGIF